MNDKTDLNKTIPELTRIETAWSMVASRWGATIVDSLVLSIFILVLVVLLGDTDRKIVILVGSLSAFIYYIVFEAYGFTLGKLVVGLRIVDVNGKNPGFIKASVRTAMRLIEVNPLLLGGIPAAISVFTSENRQRLGDKFAHTYVVRKKHLKELVPERTP